MNLSTLLALVGRVQELIPYLTAIVNGKTVREQVVAVYDAAKVVSGMTPTPIDDAIVKFIDGAPGRFDVAVDLIVDGLELLGVDGGGGPYGASSEDDERLKTALQARTTTYGMSIFGLIAAIRAVRTAIEIAPVVIDGIKRVFPDLFGTVTAERLPPVPRPEPVAERTEA